MKDVYIDKIKKVSFIVGVILSIGLWFVGVRYALGFFVGVLIGQINLRLTINYVNNLFFEGSFVIGSFILYAVVNYGLMILAFFLSVMYPMWLNIYMVALGLIMLKLVIYFKEIALYKKGGSNK